MDKKNKCLICEDTEHPKVKELEESKGYHLHSWIKGNKLIVKGGPPIPQIETYNQ